MSRIASTSTAMPYLALPPPSGSRSRAVGGAGTIGDLQPTDLETLPPVPPVPPVTRRAQPADDEPKNENSGASGDAAANHADAAAFRRRPTTSAAPSSSATPQFTLGTRSLRPSTGFVAQSLSQETLGAGLHIEPWQTALSSYRSAAALPGLNAPTTRLSI